MQWFKKYLLLFISLIFISFSTYAENTSSVALFKRDVLSPDPKREEVIKKTIQTHAQSLIQGESPFTGPQHSDLTLVVFFDYQCMHCKKMTSILDTLHNQNPNIKMVYKEFPILGAQSTEAAKAAIAAQKQGQYAIIHQKFMQSTGKLSKETILKIAQEAGLNMEQFNADLNSKAVDEQLQHNIKLAQELTVDSTPAILMVHGNPENQSDPKVQAAFVIGNATLEGLQKLVKELRE